MSLRRRLATLPWPLLLLVVLVFAVGAGVLGVFVLGDGSAAPGVWIGFLVAVGLSSLAGVAIGEVRRRRLRSEGRFEAVLDAGDAFRTGRAPADPAVRAEVRRMLPRQRDLLPLFHWVGPVLFGVLAVSQVPLVLDGRLRALVPLGFFAVLAVAYAVQYRRLGPRLAALDRDLRSGP